MRNSCQVLLFLVFFGVGAAAAGLSVLCDDLLAYYTNKNLLRSAEQSVENLNSLTADYDALLQQLHADPNLLKRLAPATLGIQPEDPNTIYPRVTAQQLNAARRVLAEDNDQDADSTRLPVWLERCSDPARRTILFVAGAFLIVIAFVCFGGVDKSKTPTQTTT